MKTFSIRWWLLLAWLGTAVLGNILFELGGYLQREDGRQQAFDEVRAEVIANVTQWDDPLWQSTLGRKLSGWEGALAIQDETGRRRFHYGTLPPATQPDQIVVLMEGTRPLGEIHLFTSARENPWGFTQIVLPLFLLLLPALVVAWFLERMLLRPLAAMSQAARQIAAGDLDFYLPPARVRDVAEVFAAFQAMGHALRTSLERQANLEQERRLFISAIAHDLRTPLFALRGYLEGLATGVAATPEKRTHYLAICQEQANLLEQRIANLFAYARLEYLGQTPRREPLDLCLLIKQTVERFRPHLEAKGITLHLAGTEVPCTLLGDIQLLTRVFENLLDNAVRHTPHGGSIQVQVESTAGKVHFAITDTGPGISPTDLPHLFTPQVRSEVAVGTSFTNNSVYKNNRGFTNNTGGAGLGLTIAQQILLAHGGDLSATNGTTGGAEFRGWLPASEETLIA